MKKNILLISSLIVIAILTYFNFSNSTNSILGYDGDIFWGKSKNAHLLLNRMTSDDHRVSWSTGNHTGTLVPLGAIGPQKYTTQLKGMIQNTKIADVLKEAVSDKINVILVIGDGMGPNQLSLPIYHNIASGSDKKTYFEKIMNEGVSAYVINHPYGEIVGSSASTATSIACGVKTRVGMIGVDYEGNNVESILDVAESNNYLTGLITESTIVDATPTAFYGHSTSRYDASIASQLILENSIEVLLSGGGAYFIPQEKYLSDYEDFKDLNPTLNNKSHRKDDLNLLDSAKVRGYKIINTRDELIGLENSTEKVFGLFAANAMNATIDRDDENTGEPQITEMAEKAINLLAKENKNFFLMIEVARIDFESHDNDISSVISAVKECDEVVGKAYDYYSNNSSNTLVVFTADHETGGLALTYTSVPSEEKKEIIFSNGKNYTRTKESINFDEFLQLSDQNKSIYKIFESVNSANDLLTEIEKNTFYKITVEESEMLFEMILNYRKGK